MQMIWFWQFNCSFHTGSFSAYLFVTGPIWQYYASFTKLSERADFLCTRNWLCFDFIPTLNCCKFSMSKNTKNWSKDSFFFVYLKRNLFLFQENHSRTPDEWFWAHFLWVQKSERPRIFRWEKINKCYFHKIIKLLDIKTFGLVSRIRDVEVGCLKIHNFLPWSCFWGCWETFIKYFFQ